MSKISLIAKLTCSDGAADDFEKALGGLIEASNEEAGLEVYSAHKGEDNHYWFFELYTDSDALTVHGRGEAMKPAMKALGAYLSGAPEIMMLTPVAAKGLDI